MDSRKDDMTTSKLGGSDVDLNKNTEDVKSGTCEMDKSIIATVTRSDTLFKKKKVKDYPKKLSRASSAVRVEASVPKDREHVLRWHGWGYRDTGIYIRSKCAWFEGDKYPLAGKQLPHLEQYLMDKFEVESNDDSDVINKPFPTEYPLSRFTAKDIEAIEYLGIEITTEGIKRLQRSLGQSIYDVMKFREYNVSRIPDAVAWPTCHEEVVELVKLAEERNFVIIPFGGGTSVAGALDCPDEEKRPILSLDTNMMNEILKVDTENLYIVVESGIIGQDLERELGKLGYTTGHVPDSLEFSTLGGWISTRASGMKKNTYGNIEDLVVFTRLVTPRGVLEKGSHAPRISSGPDFTHIVLGSEGTFGVITEVGLKIRPLPECYHYGSLIFPTWQMGVKFVREVAKRRWQPASFRLLDNEQFQIGWVLRPTSSYFKTFTDYLKFVYLEKVKGIDLKEMCITTIVYDGGKEEVLEHENRLNKLAIEMNGVPAGADAGKRGYTMTFVVAYVRDVALEFNILSDSLETAIPWDQVYEASRMVVRAVEVESRKIGALRSLSMMRVAQVYDTGCCMYVYFAIRVSEGMDGLAMMDHLHTVIRNGVLAFGGSLSHHHGVGKHRKQWYEKSVSSAGIAILKAAKKQLDPNNVFGSANFVDDIYSPSTSKL